MRPLILLLLTLGLVVGLLPLVVEVVQQALYASDVEYNGVYEPLRGVEMSRAYETSLDISFEVRSGLFHRWWMRILPFIGAGMGATLGFVLYKMGFRLTRVVEDK